MRYVTLGGNQTTKTSVNYPPRVGLLGLNISIITPSVLFEAVAKAVEERSRLRVAFCNVDTIVQLQSNTRLSEAVNNFEIASPDGMPLVWLSRLRGQKGIERVDGPSSMLSICEQGVSLGYRHYFYGGTDEMLQGIEANLKTQFPGIQIVGTHSPPFRSLTEEERQADIERINQAKPDLLWVGLGLPKQELWVEANQALLEPPAILAVGAAFGFTSGLVRRAPRWMQRLGLEWLFRLSQEPRRLWKRYLMGNSYFIWIVAKEMLLGDSRNKSK